MYAKGQLNLHIQYQCSVLKIKIVPVREVHKVDIRICFNQYVSCDVKFYPDNMDPMVCFFMTKLVTVTQLSHMSSSPQRQGPGWAPSWWTTRQPWGH